MLVAGSVLQLFLGIIYVWSVFVLPVSTQYNCELYAVKLTSSFMLGFFVVGIIFSGKLQQRMIKAQKIVLTGGLLAAAGMFCTAFMPEGTAWPIYVTYGAVSGFGVGAAHITIISSAQKWFPQNRGFATGISVSAFGFSAVVFAPLIELLIKTLDVRLTFLALSGAFLTVTLLTFSFIRQPDEQNAVKTTVQKITAQKQFTPGELPATREFYFISLSFMFGTSAYFVLNPSFITMAAERGLSAVLGTVLVMITGAANAAGRLIVPFLSDKMGRNKVAFAAITGTALCALLLSFVQFYAFMCIIMLIAFCFGGIMGIYPAISSDYFGIKNVGVNHGLVMLGYAVSALVFPVIIRSIAGNTVKFMLLGTLVFIGAILIILIEKNNPAKPSQSRKDSVPD